MSRRGRIVLAVVAVLLLVLILFGAVDGILTNRLWFKEVGYSKVYSTMLLTRFTLFVVFGLFVGGIVGGSMYLAYRTRPLLHMRSPEQQALDRYRMILQPRMGLWIGLIAIVIGLFAGASGQSQWQGWLLFRNGGSFGVKDPQFGLDVGYYVFRYPFWRYLLGVGFTTLFLALLAGIIIHYLYGAVRLQGEGERVTTAARAHLSTLVALFIGLKAWAYFLDRRGTLLAHNVTAANTYGAGYTAVNTLLPTKEILAWVSVLVAIAILVFSNAFVRNLQWPAMGLGLLVLSAVALGGIYPFIVQSVQVRPNPSTKESTYIQRSINATNAAFGLNNINYQPYDGSNQTPPTTLATDASTVPNIRLLDPAVVAKTYTQLQRARGFYDFTQKLDVDRYTTDAKTQDYVMGVREIDYSGQTWNWQQAHTIYTHGYGFVTAPANETVCQGQPYFVSGFLGASTQSTQGCQSSTDQFPAAESGIYYGENMGGYAIVGQPKGANPVEYDGPTANSSDAYVTYTGTGGVSVGSYFNRILYAYKYKETNFLISSVFNSNSKILYVRDPRERVQKIAPWLTLDGDPYPAVVNGRIVWIIDGYTTASTYPYSQQEDLLSATSDAQTGTGVAAQANTDINYMRNSVKATVDAYNGTVTLYAFGGADPVRDAWNQAFGGNLVKPEASIPAALAAHFRYPEDQLNVQRDLLTRFHVPDAKTFYSGQNAWQVPDDPANQDSNLKQPPYYLLAEFPGQTTPTFQLVSAMIYAGSQPNLSALISGTDIGNKPVLTVYTIPNGQTVLGPTQVQQKMVNDPVIRTQLTLFNSPTSKVVYGNLLSLPLGNGMLYVEPVYNQSTQANGYPLLRKVLLNYGDYVAYDDDVASGIKDLLTQAAAGAPTTVPPAGTSPPAGVSPPAGTQTGTTPAITAAVKQINTALADLKAAQISGDSGKYGAALDELKAATAAYDAAIKAAGTAVAPAPNVSPSGTSTGAPPGSPSPSASP
jgi:uncharacterized protein